MVVWILLGALVAHEAAHVVMAQHLGGHWRGVRIRWTRVAVVIDTTGLSPQHLGWIAAAGLVVDVSGWCGFLVALIVSRPILSSEIVGLVWFSILLAVNATPWIPGTDGWRFWQKDQTVGQ